MKAGALALSLFVQSSCVGTRSAAAQAPSSGKLYFVIETSDYYKATFTPPPPDAVGGKHLHSLWVYSGSTVTPAFPKGGFDESAVTGHGHMVMKAQAMWGPTDFGAGPRTAGKNQATWIDWQIGAQQAGFLKYDQAGMEPLAVLDSGEAVFVNWASQWGQKVVRVAADGKATQLVGDRDCTTGWTFQHSGAYLYSLGYRYKPGKPIPPGCHAYKHPKIDATPPGVPGEESFFYKGPGAREAAFLGFLYDRPTFIDDGARLLEQRVKSYDAKSKIGEMVYESRDLATGKVTELASMKEQFGGMDGFIAKRPAPQFGPIGAWDSSPWVVFAQQSPDGRIDHQQYYMLNAATGARQDLALPDGDVVYWDSMFYTEPFKASSGNASGLNPTGAAPVIFGRKLDGKTLRVTAYSVPSLKPLRTVSIHAASQDTYPEYEAYFKGHASSPEVMLSAVAKAAAQPVKVFGNATSSWIYAP